ncbi:MAG TPA: hypothetical protein VF288_00255 [Mycobacteriales bacterium]
MTAAAPGSPPSRPTRLRMSVLDLLMIPVLAVLGALAGVWGALLVPDGPRVAGHLLSLGAALGLVGLPLLCRLGARALPRFGGVVVLLGWLAAAVTLGGTTRSNGSVVLPGSGDLAVPALVFLLGGAVLGSFAALVRQRP